MTHITTDQPPKIKAKEKLADDSHARADAWRETGLAQVVVWLLLATAFTLGVVNYSLHCGKLSLPARYDDVSYLRDGLAKLNLFYKGGLGGLAYSVSLNPPHSPFATAVAFAGYALFGTHDWAPYAANGVIIFGLLAFTHYLMRGTRPWQKLAAYCFVLSAPIAIQCIYEFRPDMAVGLMTSAVIVLLLERPLVCASARYLTGTGALLGAALLSKTSVFPITLTFAGSAVLAATIRDRVLLGREANRRSIAKAWVTILLPSVLIPLPFYIFNRREIYYYITVNALGENSGIWKLHASLKTHLLYYLIGDGSMVMLRRDFEIMIWLLAAGLVAVALRRRKSEVCRAGCYLFLLAVTYAVPTTNPIKDPFLAVVFDFLLIFVSLLILRSFLTVREPILVRQIASAVLVLLAVAGAYSDRWPTDWAAMSRADALRRNAYVNELYHGILEHDPERTGQVLIAVTGKFVNADVLGYMADKDGLSTIHFVSDFTDKSLADFKQALDQSRFVIIGDQNNPEDNASTPYSAMLDRTLSMVRSRPDFELIATLPARAGKNYYLYQHRPRAA